MKLAFVDNLSVYGGLSRFSYVLCKSLVETYPSLQVDYYTNYENTKLAPELKQLKNVDIKLLGSTRPPGSMKRFGNKIKSFLGLTGSANDKKVLNEIEQKLSTGYDVAYFPCAHMMKCPKLSIPIVGTLHDFNWKYFFGTQNFPLSFVKMMDGEILKWMESPYNICSAYDVVDEAKKLYPDAKYFPEVVQIGSVVVNTEVEDSRSEKILQDLDIDFPYIIFPGNFFPHKNHLNLFTAFYLLKKKPQFASYKLLLTGMNSDSIPKGIAEYRGIQLVTENGFKDYYDVRGMGYQSNEVLDVLIKNAKLLVSPSIYEAICTPAMDAWNFGTPTAISDIPPFREHEAAWGIRSAFFDPMSPEKIADVLESYLINYAEASEDGKISKENLLKYSWKEVAKGYMDVFEKACAGQ